MKSALIRLPCKNLGINCPYIAMGETEMDVKANMMDHIQEDHPELMGDSEHEIRKVEEMIDSHIHEVGMTA